MSNFEQDIKRELELGYQARMDHVIMCVGTQIEAEDTYLTCPRKAEHDEYVQKWIEAHKH